MRISIKNAPMETDDPRGYPHRTRAGGPARLKNLTYGNVALVIAWARIIITWAPINQFSLVYSWPFLVSMGHRSDGPKHHSKVDNFHKLDDVMQSLDISYIPLMAGLVSISTRLNSTVLGFISVCKARGQDMLTCKVSRYCFLALHGSFVPNCSFVCVVYWTRFLHRFISPRNLFNGTSPPMQLIL